MNERYLLIVGVVLLGVAAGIWVIQPSEQQITGSEKGASYFGPTRGELSNLSGDERHQLKIQFVAVGVTSEEYAIVNVTLYGEDMSVLSSDEINTSEPRPSIQRLYSLEEKPCIVYLNASGIDDVIGIRGLYYHEGKYHSLTINDRSARELYGYSDCANSG